MTTWFNNARAILRRRQAKLQHPLNTADDNDEDDDGVDEHLTYDNRKREPISQMQFNSIVRFFRSPTDAFIQRS